MKELDKLSGGKIKKKVNFLKRLKRNIKIEAGRKVHRGRRQKS